MSMSEQYKEILEELNAVLEGGDVALDFEDAPSAATTLRIISNIIGNALRGIQMVEELKKILDKAYGDDEDKHKELSK
tara:strand:+ start:793 stop:1026 length:234 start_codon:yes stop_codon:yes gene_type:complete